MEARFAQLLARLVRYYHHTLLYSPAARKALWILMRQRWPDIVQDPPAPPPDAALIERHVIGFADGTLHQVIPGRGEIVEQLRLLGILDKDGRERFVGHMAMPVFDDQERVVQVAFYAAAGGGGNDMLMKLRCPGGSGDPPLQGPPAATWLFDETPTFWNAASLKHARHVILVPHPLLGLPPVRIPASAIQDSTAVIAPAGPGVPLGQGAKDLLSLHAPRVTILADDPSASRPEGRSHTDWAAALAREIEPLGVAVAVESRPEVAPTPEDADAPADSATTQIANDKSQMTNNKFRSPASRIVSQDRDGLTVEFPRRIRFVVQGLVQDSPRHLRASVKAFRGGGATLVVARTAVSDAAAPVRAGTSPAPPRIHLDTLDLYHARSRLAFAKTAACLLGEDPAVMEEHMAQVVALAEEFLKKVDATAPSVVLTESEKSEALALLRDPRLLDRVLADLAALGYVGEETNKLVAYVAGVSRKLEDALSVLVVSRSGAGKSTLAEAVGMLAPEEDVLRLTRLTPQTLYYQKKDALAHKLVLIEEAEGVEEAAYALRVLQSARHLSLSTAAGRGDSQTREVKGPVSLFMTTTRTDVNEETASRFLILTADESAEQTRRILEAQRAAEAKLSAERMGIVRIHQNAQRLLRPLAVVNPYALQLTFPHERLSARRDHKRYLGLIRAVAFLHQHQRTIRDDAIVVDPRDIEVANRLANEALGQSLYDLSAPSRRLLIAIREWMVERAAKEGGQPNDIRFTQRQLREYTTWKPTQLHHHVKELVQAEYLLVIAGGSNGRRTEYRLDWDGQGMDGERFHRGLVDLDTLVGCLSATFREAPERSKQGPNGPEKAKNRRIRKTFRPFGET